MGLRHAIRTYSVDVFSRAGRVSGTSSQSPPEPAQVLVAGVAMSLAVCGDWSTVPCHRYTDGCPALGLANCTPSPVGAAPPGSPAIMAMAATAAASVRL